MPNRDEQAALHEFKAAFFKALGHPLRLRILEVLREGETSVSGLQERLGADQSALSQHLAVLRQRGFVMMRKEGTTSFYSVADTEVFAFLDLGRKIFERYAKKNSELYDSLRTSP